MKRKVRIKLLKVYYYFRAIIVRKLKGLEDVITMDVVDNVVPTNGKGWKFSPEKEGCTADTVHGKLYLKEIFQMSHPLYVGKISVPVLFDKQTNTIVSVESSEIMLMLNSEFNEFCATEAQAKLDLYPTEKQKEIDELTSWILP